MDSNVLYSKLLAKWVVFNIKVKKIVLQIGLIRLSIETDLLLLSLLAESNLTVLDLIL